MNKYLTRVFVIMLFMFALVGCGSQGASQNGDSSQPKENAETPKEDFVFAMSGLYPPFNYKDNGELVGFDVEIGTALAKKMGMNPKPVTNPWQTILAALKAEKFNAIIGSMAITDERKKEVDFSDPYYESGAQIFVSKDNNEIKSVDDIKGKKIGVVVSSSFEDVAKKYTDQVVTYDSDVTALQDLLVKGRLDAVITDELVGKYAINQNDLKIKAVADPLYLDQMGIPVVKGNKELLDKINKALAEMKEDGTYGEISKKYFGEEITK